MHIEEIINKIETPDANVAKLVQGRFDALIKPVGSLAKLETMTTRYASIIGKYDKEELNYPEKALLVFAGMEQADYIEKLMLGKTPINIMAESLGAKVFPLLIMSETKADAYEEGMALLGELVQSNGLDMIGIGCLAPVEDKMVATAMAGAILQAAALKKGIMLDGVATCRAALKAVELAPLAKEYCFAGHVSHEAGAEQQLQELELEAALRLNIPEGSGEGALVAFSLLQAGIKAYKEMETFEEAGVHIEMKEYSRKEEVKASHWKQL